MDEKSEEAKKDINISEDAIAAISEDAIGALDINETNVDIAVRFLSNSNVKETDKHSQEVFLKRKGLSQAEINLAFQRRSEHVAELDVDAMLFNEGWKFFDYVKGLVLGTGMLSAANYAYKAYVLPYATRELKDDARLECLIESFQAVKDDIKQHTYELTGTLKQLQLLMEENQKSISDLKKNINKNGDDSTPSNIAELKSELTTIKSMMLSRKEFPAVPYSAPKVNEIPAWQKIADEFNAEKLTERSSRKVENASSVKHTVESKANQPLTVEITTEPFVPVDCVELSIENAVETEEEDEELLPIVSAEARINEDDRWKAKEYKSTNIDISLSTTSTTEDLSLSTDHESMESAIDVPVTTEVNGIVYEVVPNLQQLQAENNFPTEVGKEMFIEGTDVLKCEYDLTPLNTSEHNIAQTEICETDVSYTDVPESEFSETLEPEITNVSAIDTSTIETPELDTATLELETSATLELDTSAALDLDTSAALDLDTSENDNLNDCINVDANITNCTGDITQTCDDERLLVTVGDEAAIPVSLTESIVVVTKLSNEVD